MRKLCNVALAAALLGLAAGSAVAEPPAVHALTGARIVPAPGEEIAAGVVVIRDGVIEAVGSEVEIPPDARLWELDEGLSIYPGLIEPFAVLPWPEEDDDAAPQGGHDNALVRPERDMALHARDQAQARKLREAGFTTAVVVPRQGLFRGWSALVNLGVGPVGENLLRRGVAQNVDLQARSDGGYPESLMGAVALFRQTLLDARWYALAREAYQLDPAQERPTWNTALEALVPVAEGRETVVFESEAVLDTLRTASLVDEFDLDAVVVGSGDEYRRLAAVAAAGLPLIVPVDFPDPPAVGEEDDLTVDLADLRHWDAAPGNPLRLLDAGVAVVFTSHRLAEPKQIHPRLATAIERGLTPEGALAALTTTPAALFGVGGRLGTVEPGKVANLVVVEGELFTEGAKVRELWIDGRRLEVKETRPPEVDPAGSWALIIDAGQGGQYNVTLRLAGEPTALSGSISLGGGDVPLSSAEVSGETVEVSFDSTSIGMPGTITIKLKVEGDTATGNGISPRGDFSVTGTRTSKPDPEVLR